MIKKECLSRDWIETISQSKKADRIFVEKVIRALMLLEGLALSDLAFVIKGGTALMLMLDSSRRLSIDIDILVPNKMLELEAILDIICQDYGFTRHEKQERMTNSKIDREAFFYLYQIWAMMPKDSQ